MYTHSHVHTLAHAHTLTRTHPCTCPHRGTHSHAHTHAHAPICTCARTNTCTLMHLPSQRELQPPLAGNPTRTEAGSRWCTAHTLTAFKCCLQAPRWVLLATPANAGSHLLTPICSHLCSCCCCCFLAGLGGRPAGARQGGSVAGLHDVVCYSRDATAHPAQVGCQVRVCSLTHHLTPPHTHMLQGPRPPVRQAVPGLQAVLPP